jgi:hypothetical protein
MPAWSNGIITTAADVHAAIQRANRHAVQRGNLALLPQPVTTGSDAIPDATGLLPADPQLAPLLPWRGLRRGTTVTVTGSTTLLMILLAGAMRDTDTWAAVVGMPELGWVAAAEHGVDTARIATVPDPGPDWPTIVSALIDGVDLVVVATPTAPAAAIARSLAARARQKGAVLVTTSAWPGADLALEADGPRWHGPGAGRGRLRHAELEVRAHGRGRAVRPKTATLTIGSPTRLRLPQPQVTPIRGETPANGLWANMQPSPPPADPWATMTAPARTC